MRALSFLIAFWVIAMGSLTDARAQVRDEVLLILDVKENDRFSPHLTGLLERQLGRTGHRLQPSERLRPEQRSLRDERRLVELSRETETRLLLWGEVRATSDGRRAIDMWLFDAAAPASGGVYDFLRCRPEQLDTALPELAERILATFQQTHGKTVPVVVPDKKPVVAKPVEGNKRRLPRWRLGLAGSLGVLAAATLAGSITLSVLHGQPDKNGVCQPGHDLMRRSCVFNYTGPMIGGYVLTGLLGAGAWLTLALPSD